MPKVINRGTKKASSSHIGINEQPKVATELAITDRATKRVIAPFVRIVRRDQKVPEVEESKQFSYYLQKKPSVLIRDLSSFLSDSVDLASLLHETADVLKNVTKAAGVTLYMMDPATHEIYVSKKIPVSERHKIRWRIKRGMTVASYVAYQKDYVMVDDIMEDERFPQGIGYESDKVKAVLCIPVVTPDGECFAVIELYKLLFDLPFNKDDLKITLIVTGWMGAAIHQNSKRLALKRQQELNDYLLDLTKCFFGESVFMEKMISEIVKFARVTLNAERAAMFIIDSDTGDDLVADLFDDVDDNKDTTNYKKPQKVRFGKERGIAALVARSGVTVNVRDAYRDARFNKEIDQKTGFITRSILCMPIVGSEGILGVVQVVNKKNGGSFTTTDENLFKTFCVYGSLALRYTKVQKQLNQTRQLNNCFLQMLRLQLKPCIHDTTYWTSHNRLMEVPIPFGFDQFSWYIENEDHNNMPAYCLRMFTDVLKSKELNTNKTLQYILTIRKFYRRNPFHNFEHAFNVCHCMHLILKRNISRFEEIEVKALILAALSHDLDHGGFTNNFLELVKDDLAYLYDSSILEHHHLYVAMFLLDSYEIFNHIDKDEYNTLKVEMKKAIIATDLQMYFINKTRLKNVIEDPEGFNWKNPTHRSLLKAIMMTAADLSAISKPFLVSKRITDNLYAEFYRQGDIEKERGLCPLSIMDREKSHEIPEDQVKFISIIALPCYELLQTLLPNTEVLYTEAKLLMQTWQDIIDIRGKKCWRQDDSIVEKRYNY